MASDLERCLLGTAMDSPSRIDEVLGGIEAEWYSDDMHRRMHELLLSYSAEGVLDCDIILHRLSKDIEGLHLAVLAEYVGYRMISASRVPVYVDELREEWAKRVLGGLGKDLASKSTGSASKTEMLGAIEQTLQGLATTVRQDTRSFSDLAELTMGHFEAEVMGSGEPPIPTGLPDLDRKIVGLRRGAFSIAAGRPAMGKTSLALDIARGATAKGSGVVIYSLEMSAVEVCARLLSQEAMVNIDSMRRGDASGAWRRIAAAGQSLHGRHLLVNDSARITAEGIAADVRKLKKSNKIDLVIIDYLQLLRSAAGNPQNREREVAEFSRGLKILSRSSDVSVLAVAQLNRQTDTQTSGRPSLSFLRESGALEQDADLVMLVYRQEYYDKSPEHKGKAEIIVAKNRHGPVGSVECRWLPEFTTFRCATKTYT